MPYTADMGKKRKSIALDENSNPNAESVKCFLRSVLLPSKNGVPAAQLQDVYTQLVGEEVPFKQLKFDSLDDFIRSIPDVVERKWHGGKLYYVAVADEKTQHIKDMVAKQKDNRPKSKRRKMDHTGQFSSAVKSETVPKISESTDLNGVKETDRQIPNDLIPSIRAVLATSKNGIHVNNLQGEFKRLVGTKIPHRKMGFSTLHSFIETIPDVVRIERRNAKMLYVAVPIKQPIKLRKPQSDLKEDNGPEQCLVKNQNLCESTDLDLLKTSIRAVLNSSRDGLLASKLQGEFIKLVGKKIPHHSFGFSSIYSFMETIPDVAKIERKNGNIYYIAVPQKTSKKNHNQLSDLMENENPQKNNNTQSDLKENLCESTDLDLLKISIRVVLITSKHGILANKLQDEFMKLVGKKIPHHTFGFSSVYSFMETLTDVVKIERRNGNIFYVAVPEKTSTQISQSDLKDNDKPQQWLLKNHKPWETTNLNLLKAAITAVLNSSKDGILASKLQGEFTKMIGKKIPHHTFGFSCLYSFMETLTDVGKIERRNGNIFYVAVPQEPLVKPLTGLKVTNKPMTQKDVEHCPQGTTGSKHKPLTEQNGNNVPHNTIWNMHKSLSEVGENDKQQKTSANNPKQLLMGHSENTTRATDVVLSTNALMNLREKLCSCCKDVFDQFEFPVRFAHGNILQPPQYNGQNDRYKYTEEYSHRFAQ